MADSEDNLSPAELREWFTREMRNLKREHDLRVKDATDFVTAYEAGKITATEADARWSKYLDRWSEPFQGQVNTNGQMTDEEIVKDLDQANYRRLHNIRSSPRGR